MKVLFISLGCDKNLADSEYMLGLLREGGISITDEEEEADVIVVNTCCFIGDAKEESIQTILDMAQYKTDGKRRGLIVAGCLAERYREEIRTELPEVDAVLGTNSCEDIVNAVHAVMKGDRYESFRELAGLPTKRVKREPSTGGHYAYLKIAEGCDKRCTYCIIPSIRGAYRSVPLEELLVQARELVAQGVKELILVAQETTGYRGISGFGFCTATRRKLTMRCLTPSFKMRRSATIWICPFSILPMRFCAGWAGKPAMTALFAL